MKKTISLPVPQVPVSWGELIDKITILEVKIVRLSAEKAVMNVRKELSLLASVCIPEVASDPVISNLTDRLRSVNEELWRIEDSIREKERIKLFDAEFIEMARSVYMRNDERAALKKEINNLLNSEVIEEKSYKPY